MRLVGTMPGTEGRTPGRPTPVVLVVDDNAAMRALVRSLVEETGAVVHECEDGEHAVVGYGRLRPDWVLMDIRLGGMDGLAAAGAIRALDPAAQVIMVTEHEGAGYRRAAAAAGAKGYLLKRDLLQLPALLGGLPRPP